MELNPYQPPVVAAPTLADEQHAAERPAPRPIGIWILSGLHLLVGLLLLFGTLVIAGRLVTGLQSWSFLIGLLVTIIALFAALALATSVGLWLGAQWGWWLTAFYYVWAILGVLADLSFSYWRLGPEGAEFMAAILPAKLTQIAVHGLILLYLFKGSVRDFCSLQSLSMAKALVVLTLIAIVVLAATAIFGWLYLQGLPRMFAP